MMNKIREREDHTLIFILVHSLLELQLIDLDYLSLIMHYIKSFTKSLKDYTFE